MDRVEKRAVDRRFFALQPLVAVGAAFALGMAVGHAAGWGVWVDISLLAVACAAAAGGLWRRWRAVAMPAILMGAFFCGAGLWHLDQEYVAGEHIARLMKEGAAGDGAELTMMTVRVRIVTEPVFNPPSPDLPLYLSKPTTHFVGEAQAVQSTRGWIAATGLVTVSVRDRLQLHRGELVEICGWGRRPLGPANPGEFDYRRFLAASGIHGSIFATFAEQLKTIAGPRSVGPQAWLDDFRVYLRQRLLEHIGPEDADAGNTMVALLLGYRSPGMQPITGAFSDAGIAHLLAISGTHIVFMAAFFSWVLRLVIPRPRLRGLVTAALICVYMAATPGGPPVLRAGLGMLLFFGANLLTRRAQAANLLAAALVVILAVRPGDLVDAGFQLSFAATAGLVLLWPRLHAAVFGRFLERRAAIARAIGTRWAAWRHVALRWLCGAVGVNAVGSLISVPLVAFHFNQFNGLSIVTGLVALPAVVFLMIVSLAQLVVSVLWTAGAAAISGATAWCGAAVVWLVGVLARLPGATMAVRAPPWWVVALAYVMVVIWLVRRRVGLSRATVTVAGVLVVVLAGGWYAITQRTGAHLWLLDVGRGNCIVAESPDGKVMVIDAGSQNRPEIASRVLAPFLKQAGIGRLDALVITQVDDAHTSGVAGLLERYRPAAVFCGAADAQRRAGLAVTRFFGNVRNAGRAVQGIHAGEQLTLGRDMNCEVFWPPERSLGVLPVAQTALILRLGIGDSRVLLTGPSEGVGLMASGATGPQSGGVIPSVSGELSPDVAALLRAAGVALLAPALAEDTPPSGDETVPDLRPRRLRGCVEIRMDGHGLNVRRLQP